MFDRPFRKHEFVSLATYVHIYKSSDIVDRRGMGTIHKGMPPICGQGKAGGTAVNKHVNVSIEYAKHTKNPDSFVKQMKENEQRKKQAKGKGSRVCASLHPNKSTLSEPAGRSMAYQNPWPMSSWQSVGRK